MGDGFFQRQISRRELFKKAGVGVGALSIARHLTGNPAAASARVALSADPGAPLMLARVRPGSAAESVALAVFDDTHRRFADGSVELLLWPGDLARLKDLGVDFKITCSDLVKRDIEAARSAEAPPLLPPPGGTTSYRVLADYERELQAFPTTYPTMAKLITLPNKTFENRTVYGVEIAANVNDADGRPTIYYDGIHHAREWPAGEFPMIWAYYLLENYGTDARVRAILDNARIVVIPVMNPDGFHKSRHGMENANLGIVAGGQEAYWRKNRRAWGGNETTVPNNALAYGVDPNRNYAFLWGATTGGAAGLTPAANALPAYASTSPNPYDQTYFGPEPISEPENKNVAGFLLGRNVTGMITSHTNGRLILRPWGHTEEPSVDEEFMAGLGDQMQAITGYISQIGLSLYPTTGTTDDWYYAAAGGFGYTFEHGGSEFHPPYNNNDAPGKFWNKVVSAFLLHAEAAVDGSKHCVIRGRAHEPGDVEAGVQTSLNGHKEFETPMWPQGADGTGALVTLRTSTHEVIDINTVSKPDGTIEWHINPTTRPLEAAAGRTETLRVRISAPGRQTIEHQVSLRRGEALDLGSFPMP
jgi:hypothetical protein